MKGFVGGIPLALLAAAAQAMEHGTENSNGMQSRGLYPQPGGTAMGGPSGNDEDGGFTSPYSAHVHAHANVNEYSKDDHSIEVKDTDVYPPPAAPWPYDVAMAPGMGPFEATKRDWPHSATVIGGPSGDDEGQTFDMPITGNFHTDVNEFNKDDHSIKLKDEHVYARPSFHPPGVPAGFRESPDSAPSDDFHIPAEAFAKRWGPEAGGTVMGGPGGGSGPDDFAGPIEAGGTAMGGPSGPDYGIDFDAGVTGNFHTNVNEYSHDDHSIDLKHTDIYPPPPMEFGPPGFGAPFKRGWEPEESATVMGGPSGDDGGQSFNMPITVDTHTGVNEHWEDDHSIDVNHKDVYPSFGGPGPYIPRGGVTPFRRAYSPDSPDRMEGGGTAMGGPSGEDDGINFGTPTDIGVDSNVNEHHEDNHAIKAESTDVHLPHMPWMSYHEAPAPHPVVVHEHPVEAPPSPPVMEHEEAPPSPPVMEYEEAPPSPPVMEHEEAPTCAPQVHEVVRTVTKTQTQVLHPTETVTETPAMHVVQSTMTVHHTETVTQTPVEHVAQVTKTVYETPKEHVVQVTETVYETPTQHVVQTHAIPMSAVPMETPMSKVYASTHGSQYAPMPSASSSYMPHQSYEYMSQRPMSSGTPYSMIPIRVPMASSASSHMSMASPSMMPSGADPMHSSMASASATPSHGTMFKGDAARLSGGIVSVAAAVFGVLALVL